MRNSIHSIRFAVFMLLGILISALPVANTAYGASVSLPIVTPDLTQLASNSVYCSYDQALKKRMVYKSLTSLPVTRLMPYLPQTIAIAKEDPKTQQSSLSLISPSIPQQPTISPTQPSITATPTPQPENVASFQPQAARAPAAVGATLNADVLFSLVNAHRTSIGLPPFQHDPRVQAVASSRAPELDYEIYGGGGMHAGFYARDLGYWATENMISMPTEQAALTWWLNSPVHRSAIEGNYQYAAVGCAGRSCAMIFTNFAPK